MQYIGNIIPQEYYQFTIAVVHRKQILRDNGKKERKKVTLHPKLLS